MSASFGKTCDVEELCTFRDVYAASSPHLERTLNTDVEVCEEALLHAPLKQTDDVHAVTSARNYTLSKPNFQINEFYLSTLVAPKG